MPEITVSQLSQTFGSTKVLDEVDFTVPDGSFVTLLGPSGCGKTTTLMSIAGFHTPDTGTITHGDRVLYDAAGRNLPAEQRDLGIVFQSYALWPHLTVAQNVAFPLKIRRARRVDMERRVTDVLELVELVPRAGAYPHELSGGQQQRVALARALAHGPSALLTPPSLGLPLAGVYAVWLFVVIVLYPLCKKYDRYKSAHKEKWWLSYL